MGDNEAALLRLWREKRGEVEPEDHSDKLLVQLGKATEDLNRRWYERNTGHTIEGIQRRVRHGVLRWMGATLDGIVAGKGAVFEAKFAALVVLGGGRSRETHGTAAAQYVGCLGTVFRTFDNHRRRQVGRDLDPGRSSLSTSSFDG